MTRQEEHEALQLLVKRARTDFATFCYLMHPQGCGAAIKWAKVHRILMQQVQDIFDGFAPKLNAVSLPPQHGKSTLLSVLTTAWLIGARPGICVAITGFSHNLVTKFSKGVRGFTRNGTYRKVFPRAGIVYGSNKMEEWELTNGSSVTARSEGSKLTGRRVDWLILDDVHAGRSEAESPVKRAKVVEWYMADCVSRMSENAVQYLIGTRWHPDDLTGKLMDPTYQRGVLDAGGEVFHFHNFKALCEEGDPDDGTGRLPGEALFEVERSATFLRGIRATVPSYEWESQYQGNPRAASFDGQAEVGNLLYISPDEVPWHTFTDNVRGWDLALSEKQTADWTAGPKLGWDANAGILYVLEVQRFRKNWGKVRTEIIDIAKADANGTGAKRTLRVGLEGVGAFQGMVDDVKKALLGLVKVETKNPQAGSKLLRAQPWLNLVEAGRVIIVRGPWNKDFVDELRTFPHGAHDDQVDGVSVGYEMLVPNTKEVVFLVA